MPGEKGERGALGPVGPEGPPGRCLMYSNCQTVKKKSQSVHSDTCMCIYLKIHIYNMIYVSIFRWLADTQT